MKITSDIEKESVNRITNRNSRTLLLNISEDMGITNKDALKKLVPNAVNIRLPFSRNKILKTAFVEYASKDEADKQYTLLQAATFPIGSVNVQFMGRDKTIVDMDINPCRLYISGIPFEAQTEELKKLFPKANIGRNDTSKFRNRADFKTFAILEFSSEEDAKSAFWAAKDVEILGTKLLVLFAKNDVKNSKLNPIKFKKELQTKMKIKRLQKSANSNKSASLSTKSKLTKNKPQDRNLKDSIKKAIEKGLIKFDEMETD